MALRPYPLCGRSDEPVRVRACHPHDGRGRPHRLLEPRVDSIVRTVRRDDHPSRLVTQVLTNPDALFTLLVR